MDNNNEFDLSELYLLMRPKNIYICKGVSEKQIIESILDGCDTISKIAAKTKATTGCGSCSLLIRSILERELKK